MASKKEKKQIECIAKYTSFLNEMKEMIIKNKGNLSSIDQSYLIEKHRVSKNSITAALRANYIQRVSRSNYKLLIGDFQPIHAKNVVALTQGNKRRKALATKTAQNKPVPIKNKKVKAHVSETLPEQNVKIAPKKEEKVCKKVSILWGLYSYTKYN